MMMNMNARTGGHLDKGRGGEVGPCRHQDFGAAISGP